MRRPGGQFGARALRQERVRQGKHHDHERVFGRPLADAGEFARIFGTDHVESAGDDGGAARRGIDGLLSCVRVST